MRDLELADYERMFARRRIYTGTRDDAAAAPLYERLLGSAWHELPSEIRAMHDLHRGFTARGTADVARGKGLLARLLARAIGFPAPMDAIPVTVRFAVEAGVETWTRSFGDETFSSAQFAGEGRDARLLCERFGWLTCAMALVLERGRLSLVPRRWHLLGIPLPMWLCPRVDAHESVENGRFHFHVDIRHALAGLIVRYEGSLATPER
jgi:hypothetical protein